MCAGSGGLYGRRKMLALIRRIAFPKPGSGAADRAMRSLGLAGVVSGKRPRTTNPQSGRHPGRGPAEQGLHPSGPDQKWATDFTYVRTCQSFTCVAFIVDCFSHQTVGWHASVKWYVELPTCR